MQKMVQFGSKTLSDGRLLEFPDIWVIFIKKSSIYSVQWNCNFGQSIMLLFLLICSLTS